MNSTEVIVAEYSLSAEKPETADELAQLKRCLAVREAKLLRTYAAPDGSKLIRVFEAPDAGAVRFAHASSGYANVTVWPANERDAL
jgi:hypothetical protein